MSRKALGKGLSALISETRPAQAPPAAAQAGVSFIPIESISPNPSQPRKVFQEEALNELAESIRSLGLLQPILVKRTASGYELIAGERRLRAADRAGLTAVPVVVKDAGREESRAMAVVENIQRENLNPIEQARAYQGLADDFGLDQEDVSRLVGKDRATVANYLRLLKLPSIIQDDLSADRLTMGHARALLGLSDRARQLEARERILARGLSVRETEILVRRLAGDGKAARRVKKPAADPHLSSIQEELKRKLGTKVRLSSRGRGGAIHIFYHSADELERLIELLLATGNR